MGRHHVKLPNHLYISPPSPQPSSALAFASALFSPKSGLEHTSASLLSNPVSTTRALGRRIPGFRTSAAFLTALRANIDPQLDAPDSPANTPDSLRPLPLSSSTASLVPLPPPTEAMSTSNIYSDADLAPPAALQPPMSNVPEPELEPESEEAVDPQSTTSDSLPELTTFAAIDDPSRIEALRLVADSVAQQRQRASRALIFHPITFGILAVAFALLRQYFYKGTYSDYAIIGTTFAGIVMTLLVTIRSQTGAYIEEAERVGTWRWLSQGRSVAAEKETGKRVLGDHDDEILVTKFGHEYIGAIVFRGVQSADDTANTPKKPSRKSVPQPRTEIRAWTVRQKYRGKGVGTALLDDAIRVAHEKGWAQGGVEIAPDHANHKVVLPTVFSGFVQKNDERARQYIAKKVTEYEEANSTGKSKKRR